MILRVLILFFVLIVVGCGSEADTDTDAKRGAEDVVGAGVLLRADVEEVIVWDGVAVGEFDKVKGKRFVLDTKGEKVSVKGVLMQLEKFYGKWFQMEGGRSVGRSGVLEMDEKLVSAFTIDSLSFREAVVQASIQANYSFHDFGNVMDIKFDGRSMIAYGGDNGIAFGVKGLVGGDSIEISTFSGADAYTYFGVDQVVLRMGDIVEKLKRVAGPTTGEYECEYLVSDAMRVKGVELLLDYEADVVEDVVAYRIAIKEGARIKIDSGEIVIEKASLNGKQWLVQYSVSWAWGKNKVDQEVIDRLVAAGKNRVKPDKADAKQIRDEAFQKRMRRLNVRGFEVLDISGKVIEHRNNSKFSYGILGRGIKGKWKFEIDDKAENLEIFIGQVKRVNKRLVFKGLDLSGNKN